MHIEKNYDMHTNFLELILKFFVEILKSKIIQ